MFIFTKVPILMSGTLARASKRQQAFLGHSALLWDSRGAIGTAGGRGRPRSGSQSPPAPTDSGENAARGPRRPPSAYIESLPPAAPLARAIYFHRRLRAQ